MKNITPVVSLLGNPKLHTFIDLIVEVAPLETKEKAGGAGGHYRKIFTIKMHNEIRMQIIPMLFETLETLQ